MDIETRLVPGFPGYAVDVMGNVYSCRRGNRWKKLKAVRNGYGYMQVSLLGNAGKMVSKIVSRVVLETFVGPKPEGMGCCHGPLGKGCDALHNLSWGTSKKNREDTNRDGNMFRGEAHHFAGMTEERARYLLSLKGTGTVRGTARREGVAPTTLGHIWDRETWKHLDGTDGKNPYKGSTKGA